MDIHRNVYGISVSMLLQSAQKCFVPTLKGHSSAALTKPSLWKDVPKPETGKQQEPDTIKIKSHRKQN